MGLKYTNNATSVLAGAITAASGQFSVSAGQGALFPVLGDGDWFPLTVVDANGTYEIMRCTARNNDLVTVTRAQEGTPANAFPVGSRVDLRFTAAALSSLIDADAANSDAISEVLNKTVRVDAAQAYSGSQKTQGRANIDAAALNGDATKAFTASVLYAQAGVVYSYGYGGNNNVGGIFLNFGGSANIIFDGAGFNFSNWPVLVPNALTVNLVNVKGGSIYTYGYGGNNAKGDVRFGISGAAYLHYDGAQFIFTGGSVYAPNGRLWGSGDFATSPVTDIRWSMAGDVPANSSGGWTYFSGAVIARIRSAYSLPSGYAYDYVSCYYLQKLINGSWYTVAGA